MPVTLGYKVVMIHVPVVSPASLKIGTQHCLHYSLVADIVKVAVSLVAWTLTQGALILLNLKK